MKDLLLLLAHYPYNPSTREALKSMLSEVTDWNSFIRLINAHGIIALAAYNIKEARLENIVPVQAMAMLENGLRQSIVRNAWLTERWKEVNEILTGAGIQHLLLKGMALEHTVYGAKGLRQMTDNDILVRRKDAVKAWHLLQENGFQVALPKSSLHFKILPEAPTHLPALYKENFALEIHTKLFGEAEPDLMYYEQLFVSVSEIEVVGQKALVLPKDAHEKYLLHHYNRHISGGECQVRTWQDLRILFNGKQPSFPDEFIFEPDQKRKRSFKKFVYRDKIRSLPMPERLIYLTGDIFPSVQWMKTRYKCTSFGALLRYPHRLGKLLWLI